MTAFSIHDRIAGWVDDQITKEDPLGADEWGRHITMAMMPTERGEAIIWVILITLRSPVLGEDALGGTAKVAGNIPPETALRGVVSKTMENLRKARDAKKTEGLQLSNGHSPNGLPPGLKGLRLG